MPPFRLFKIQTPGLKRKSFLIYCILIWLVNIAWFDIARDWQFNLAAGLFDSSKAVSIFRFQGSYFQIQVWQAEFLLQSSKNCFQSTCPAFFCHQEGWGCPAASSPLSIYRIRNKYGMAIEQVLRFLCEENLCGFCFEKRLVRSVKMPWIQLFSTEKQGQFSGFHHIKSGLSFCDEPVNVRFLTIF